MSQNFDSMYFLVIMAITALHSHKLVSMCVMKRVYIRITDNVLCVEENELYIMCLLQGNIDCYPAVDLQVYYTHLFTYTHIDIKT